MSDMPIEVPQVKLLPDRTKVRLQLSPTVPNRRPPASRTWTAMSFPPLASSAVCSGWWKWTV